MTEKKKSKLYEKCAITPEIISSILSLNYPHLNLTLGSLIKAAQNHTYRATNISSINYIIRVTPDPESKQEIRISDEITILNYLRENHLTVCPAIPTVSGAPLVRYEKGKDSLILVVFEYAKGQPFNPISSDWMIKKEFLKDWGKWMGKLHNLCRRFTKENKEVSARVRLWTELHDRVMEGVDLEKEDLELMKDENFFGVNHGDVNISNFFYDEERRDLWVFDWDQIQRSWFLYDLAQVIYLPWMMSSAGSPVDGSPIICDLKFLVESLLEGYEEVSDSGKVDRTALKRMILLRKQFYERFCRRAMVEVEGDEELLQMMKFFKYVVGWMDTKPEFPRLEGE